MTTRIKTTLLALLFICSLAHALDLMDLGNLASPGTASSAAQPVSGKLILDRPIDPETYRLGPGDRLGLYAYNVKRTSEQHDVDSDGRLELPGLGRVPVAGLSLAELRRQTNGRLKRIFVCDSLDLWIVAPRQIRVQVSGMGQETRLMELDYQSRLSATMIEPRVPTKSEFEAPLWEVTMRLAWRNVTIQRGETRLNVDLLYYLRTGDQEGNPVLESGDRVIWGQRGATIHVEGPFMQKGGEVEFRESDTPARLAALMGGPQAGLTGLSYELVRPDPNGQIEQRWDFTPEDPLYRSLVVQAHDRLYLRVKNERDTGWQAEIVGSVFHPGSYPIKPGHSTLADLLKLAQPDSSVADLDHIRLLRKLSYDPERNFLNQILANGDLTRFERDYLKSRILHEGSRVSMTYDGRYFDPAKVPLLDGDKVEVLRRGVEVEILGGVNQPGAFVWHKGWRTDDYLTAAGGRMRGTKMTDMRLRRSGADQFEPMPANYEPMPGDIIMLMLREEMTAWERFKEGLSVMSQILTVVLVVRSI